MYNKVALRCRSMKQNTQTSICSVTITLAGGRRYISLYVTSSFILSGPCRGGPKGASRCPTERRKHNVDKPPDRTGGPLLNYHPAPPG